MNSLGDGLATVRYGPSDFTILTPGDHVICAVTGASIALADLRYWSHELQEAYADAAAATARWRDVHGDQS